MSRKEELVIVLLRLAAGWHFLYEGLVKCIDPAWSAAGYLKGSAGFIRMLYDNFLYHPQWMLWIDTCNIIALLLAGAGLFFGICIRLSACSGMFLLFLYYSAYPPFSGEDGVGGSFFIVDRNLIEFLLLFLIAIAPAAQNFSVAKAWSVTRNRELNKADGK